MDLLLRILAVLGFLVVLRTAIRACLRAIAREIEVFMAGETARTRGQRGDLTGMAEAELQALAARRARLASLAEVSFWIALLALPALLLSTVLHVYAAYLLVWLASRGAGARRTDIAARRP